MLTGNSEWRATSDCGCVVILARFTQSVTYFETDVASGSSAAIVSACLFVFRHLWLILVELLRQSPALLLQSVHRCESTREHQKWRLQHEAADYTSRQPHKWFSELYQRFPKT